MFTNDDMMDMMDAKKFMIPQHQNIQNFQNIQNQNQNQYYDTDSINHSYLSESLNSYHDPLIYSASVPLNYYQNDPAADSSPIADVETVERRKKRRESHNQVERRRRDHINDRITDLALLLPCDALEKANKGIVLGKSVEYIKHLQSFCSVQMDRNMELESCLLQICSRFGIRESDLSLSFKLGSRLSNE